MNHLVKLIIFAICLALVSSSIKEKTALYPREDKSKNSRSLKIKWPISHKKANKISSTFAESRYDHFHNGLDIPVRGMAVQPISKAKVLWVRNPKRRLNETPFGGGNTVVLQHDDIWSAYMHLQKIDSEKVSQELLSVDDRIGDSGRTGHSGGYHLHFFIFDFKLSRFYNPLMLINKKIIKDIKPPQLKYYRVSSSSQTKKGELVQKKIPNNTLLAKIEDRGMGSEKWGIYYLKVYDDKKNILRDLKFDYIQFLNHHWVTSNKKKFDEIYYGNQYILHRPANMKIKWEAGGLHGPSLTQKR